ncbi:MAG: inorganic phosphate transporter [Verrucomicrobia bacterium]|jgi:PiT family inorganic phosphate transporter|nr:inorganic phosphate transporter [Verrucomicrobiota bacterium]
MFLILTIVLVALVFEFINGFHDTANAIATSVATKVLSPRQAVILSAVCNLLGALAGTAVATTIGKGLVDMNAVTPMTLLCALIGAIIWNLVTWWLGLPSSSSHALIGGLCGAALATAHGNWNVLRWAVHNPATHKLEGLWPKVVLPMILAPAFGIVVGFVVMAILLALFHSWRPNTINRVFRRCQFFSAAWMSFSHGTNDAQKTMGIIALTLFTATTQSPAFDELPGWLGFLRSPEFKVYLWIKVACAITIAAGTAVGGWRIIRTLGKKMVKLQPIHGFAAQTTSAAIIQAASSMGIPLSTTHIMSTAIMGVGMTRRLNAVKWSVVERMVWAWVLTLPITAMASYGFFQLLRLVGLAG